MIYKLSDREKILLKYVGGLLIIISFISLTNYVTNNIKNSKNELFVQLDTFNESKQLLAQIKALKNEADISLSRDEFLLLITDQGLNYEINDNNILIPGLDNSDALKLLNIMEDKNIDLNSFNLTMKDDGLVSMSVDIDE
ncbi:MAG: hypothetical protein EVA99_01870 [SAR86 cluster bacterium]|uniref:Type II secretion system protein M n=1 Tax=SAR86 cluster bacterium TaxID=2030880 RepID=A0A520MSS4_9GAMM|nr:MAG: hypothetical protein EVA99_01870 [SAR86 cluster bacterium]